MTDCLVVVLISDIGGDGNRRLLSWHCVSLVDINYDQCHARSFWGTYL